MIRLMSSDSRAEQDKEGLVWAPSCLRILWLAGQLGRLCHSSCSGSLKYDTARISSHGIGLCWPFTEAFVNTKLLKANQHE